MDISDLKKVGLTDGEVRVYKALLDLGQTTRTRLAKKSDISPSKIYDVANRLIEKGLVSSVKKDGVLHFNAANPEKLKDFIEHKEQDIEKEKQLVAKVLPSLLSTYQQTKDNIDIEVFSGWDGLKSAFLTLENSMSKGDESLVFGASVGEDPEQADIFWSKHQQRLDKRGYKVRIIFNEDIRSRKSRHAYYDHSTLHEIRYLHQMTLTELYIYNDYVLTVLHLKKPIGMMLKNREAVKSYRAFFETLWKQAKS